MDRATSAGLGTVAVMATVTTGAKADRIRSMSRLQIRSIEPPLDDPETTDAAIDVLKSMEAMGLLPDDVDELTLEVIRAVATRAAEVGIGESAAASLRRPPRPPGHVAAALRELGVALEGSPMPAFEWPAMLDLFGGERLAGLLGGSVASLRRYAKDERPTLRGRRACQQERQAAGLRHQLCAGQLRTGAACPAVRRLSGP